MWFERYIQKCTLSYILRDCRQITFVLLNGFCPLSKKKTHSPLLLTDKIKMDRIRTKIKWKIHTLFILFEGLKVLLLIICKMQPLNLLFLLDLFHVRFYISRYHFSLVFRALYSVIWKKYFRYKFSFFNGFTHPPTSLTAKIR